LPIQSIRSPIPRQVRASVRSRRIAAALWGLLGPAGQSTDAQSSKCCCQLYSLTYPPSRRWDLAPEGRSERPSETCCLSRSGSGSHCRLCLMGNECCFVSEQGYLLVVQPLAAEIFSRPVTRRNSGPWLIRPSFSQVSIATTGQVEPEEPRPTSVQEAKAVSASRISVIVRPIKAALSPQRGG